MSIKEFSFDLGSDTLNNSSVCLGDKIQGLKEGDHKPFTLAEPLTPNTLLNTFDFDSHQGLDSQKKSICSEQMQARTPPFILIVDTQNNVNPDEVTLIENSTKRDSVQQVQQLLEDHQASLKRRKFALLRYHIFNKSVIEFIFWVSYASSFIIVTIQFITGYNNRI